VTLDRVVCCYPDYHDLVGLSSARAKKLYGLVYPRDTWLSRLGVKVLGFYFKLAKSSYRPFVHPTQSVDAIVRGQGFQRKFYGQTMIWQVVVYERLLPAEQQA
jgi:hypothetical protein